MNVIQKATGMKIHQKNWHKQLKIKSLMKKKQQQISKKAAQY